MDIYLFFLVVLVITSIIVGYYGVVWTPFAALFMIASWGLLLGLGTNIKVEGIAGDSKRYIAIVTFLFPCLTCFVSVLLGRWIKQVRHYGWPEEWAT